MGPRGHRIKTKDGNYVDLPEAPDVQSDIDNATHERSQRAVPKLLIVPIAIVVIGLLAGLPLLRVLVLEQDDEATRRHAASEARNQVAILFSVAVLEERSNRASQRYVIASIRDHVAAIISDIRLRDSAELEGAVSTTERILCRQPAAGGECFRSRLARPNEAPVAEITFVVAITDGAARVIAIGDGGMALGHGRR